MKVVVPWSVWQKVSAKMGEWPSRWYQQNEQSLNATPNEGVWTKLSVDLAGFNLSKQMARRILYQSIGLSVLFILVPMILSDIESDSVLSSNSTVAYRYEFESPADSEKKSGDQKSLLASNNSQSRSQEISVNQSVEGDVSQGVLVRANENQLVEPIIIDDEPLVKRSMVGMQETDNVLTNVVSEGREESIVAFDVSSLSTVGYGSVDQGLLRNQATFSKFSNTVPRGSWYVGPRVNFQFSSLLNPLTSEAFSSSKHENQLIYSTSYGLSAVREFRRGHAIGINAIAGDRKAQLVRDTEAQGTEHVTELMYSTLSIEYRKNMIQPKAHRKNRMGVNLIAGVFGSYRMSFSEMDPIFMFGEDGYKSYDIGATFGADYYLNIGKRWRWFVGANYQIGATNIFKGVKKVPSNFYRTHTTAISGTTGLQFRLF